jgi:4-hydroxy-3-methylbut-2-enyl diphosphate reductase
LDLGTKHAGYIPVAELTDDPTAKVEDIVKVGDEIETFVMRVNDVEGVVTLSKKRLDTVKSWDDVEQARENRTTVEGVVTEENKGGVVVSVKGVRVFVPASQTGLPREAPMSDLLKKKVKLRITEVNRARRRVVGSIGPFPRLERASRAARCGRTLKTASVTARVKSLTPMCL